MYKCKSCGISHERHYSEDVLEQMTSRGFCFGCNFWENYAAEPHPNRVIIKGTHFVACQPGSGFQGFGGRKWKITRLDGKEDFCPNLWHQGDIPQQFRGRLPDNASKLESI